jgi:hypothetical protein
MRERIDVHEGVTVTITDNAANVFGTGQLDVGHMTRPFASSSLII